MQQRTHKKNSLRSPFMGFFWMSFLMFNGCSRIKKKRKGKRVFPVPVPELFCLDSLICFIDRSIIEIKRQDNSSLLSQKDTIEILLDLN